MSEPIRDLSAASKHASSALQTKNKAELDLKRRIHEKNVQIMKSVQANELHSLREEHQLQLAQEVQKREQTLQALRQSQEQTQRLTDAETKRQQAHAFRLREEARQTSAAQIEEINQRHEDTIKDLNQRLNDTTKDVTYEGRAKIREQQDHHRFTLRNEGEEWRHRIDSQRGKYHQNYRTEAEKFEKLTNNLREKGQHEAIQVHRAHQSKLAKMNDQQVKHAEEVTQHHQKSLHEKGIFFEKKFQNQLAQHTQAENDLNQRHQQNLTQIKDELNQRVELEQRHASDPFFNFVELKPSIEEQPDGYLVKVTVPDYAKEEVTLTTNHKELVLTSNRRYQDERKDENGTLKKVSKVESIVSRIPVDQVLNPRKMTKNWSEGVLTFEVKKA